jgi:hypothetical protein
VNINPVVTLVGQINVLQVTNLGDTTAQGLTSCTERKKADTFENFTLSPVKA